MSPLNFCALKLPFQKLFVILMHEFKYQINFNESNQVLTSEVKIVLFLVFYLATVIILPGKTMDSGFFIGHFYEVIRFHFLMSFEFITKVEIKIKNYRIRAILVTIKIIIHYDLINYPF